MGYESALQAAGANILVFQSFGDYEGSWWAKVEYEGQVGWVRGSYGSCSGCDAFQAEFDYDADKCVEHRYTYIENDCEVCRVEEGKRDQKLAEFGRNYLYLFSQEEAEKYASANLEWDMDAQKVLDFVRENSI